MSYTPPAGDNVDFSFVGGYSAPSGDQVNFLFLLKMKIMGIDLDKIKKIAGIDIVNIKKIMGVEIR